MNFPTDSKGRYVRIPRPLRRKQFDFKLFGILEQLLAAHKRSISREKRKLAISDYQLIWISFFRGFFLALIVDRWIFN